MVLPTHTSSYVMILVVNIKFTTIFHHFLATYKIGNVVFILKDERTFVTTVIVS